MSHWTPVAPWKFIEGTAQKITTSGVSASSTAVGSETRAIMVVVTTDSHIRITTAGSAATTSDMLVKSAWPPIVLGCSPGSIVSVIEDASAGSLYMQELTH